ncbi:hypothetical protein P7C70_g5442, partial [Phenoliferia sp. Uapishka_3]
MSTYVREATPDHSGKTSDEKLEFYTKRSAADELERLAEKKRSVEREKTREDEIIFRLATAAASPVKATGAPKPAPFLESLEEQVEDALPTIFAFPQAVHAISPDIVAAARLPVPMPFIALSACGQQAAIDLENGERTKVVLTPGKGAGAQHPEVGVAAQKQLDAFAERDYCLDPISFWEAFAAWGQLMAETKLNPAIRTTFLCNLWSLQQLVCSVLMERHWVFWREYVLAKLTSYSSSLFSGTGGTRYVLQGFSEPLLRKIESKFNYEKDEAFRYDESAKSPSVGLARLGTEETKRLRKALALKGSRISRWGEPAEVATPTPTPPQQRQRQPEQQQQHRQQPPPPQQQHFQQPQYFNNQQQQFPQPPFYPPPPPPSNSFGGSPMKRSESAPPQQNFRPAEQRAPSATQHFQGWCPGCCKFSTDPTHFWKVCQDVNTIKVFKQGHSFLRGLDRARICMQWNLGSCGSVGPCINLHCCAWCAEEGHISFDCPSNGGPGRANLKKRA